MLKFSLKSLLSISALSAVAACATGPTEPPSFKFDVLDFPPSMQCVFKAASGEILKKGSNIQRVKFLREDRVESISCQSDEGDKFFLDVSNYYDKYIRGYVSITKGEYGKIYQRGVLVSIIGSLFRVDVEVEN